MSGCDARRPTPLRPASTGAHAARMLLGCLGIVLASACGPPIRVTHENPRLVTREITSDVLTTGRPSLPTQNVLHRWNLTELYEQSPEAAIITLHNAVVQGLGGSNEVFALSELCFKHAEEVDRERARGYYLASAVYAYAFLFPNGADEVPKRFDPRVRTASDLYNRSITEGFTSADRSEVELRSGVYQLPFGQLSVDVDLARLRWADRELYGFASMADLKVTGLEARYRRAGIGAPLAARTRIIAAESQEGEAKYIAPRARVPVTAVLLVDDARRQLGQGTLHASLETFSGWNDSTVKIDGRDVPLEVEPSATLAWSLADAPIWGWELKGFLAGDLMSKQASQLIFISPYKRGKIPVVFVHGTASSAGRWADMLNDLLADPRIRERYEFWFFLYPTGNPIPFSAMVLRDSLRDAVNQLDPQGTDAALRDMVVIGHSQGGLLTKMTAIHSGSVMWDAFSSRPLDELKLNDETRELLRGALFVEPLPFVHRVVFISTPHHGSYVAGYSLAHWVSRFVKMPGAVLGAMSDVVQGNPDALRLNPKHMAIGAVYGMTPRSPFIKSLASIPVAPGVAAHSIISVKGDGPVENGDDGVVQYQSAHIGGVESELVVRSPHSCQGNPVTIEEVRRILLEHAEKACQEGIACPASDSEAATPD